MPFPVIEFSTTAVLVFKLCEAQKVLFWIECILLFYTNKTKLFVHFNFCKKRKKVWISTFRSSKMFFFWKTTNFKRFQWEHLNCFSVKVLKVVWIFKKLVGLLQKLHLQNNSVLFDIQQKKPKHVLLVFLSSLCFFRSQGLCKMNLSPFSFSLCTLLLSSSTLRHLGLTFIWRKFRKQNLI